MNKFSKKIIKFALTTAASSVIIMLVSKETAEAASGVSAAVTACPELATDMELALISKTGPTSGRIRITGIVKNLSSRPWAAANLNHRLQMMLTQKNSDTQRDEPVQPAIGIAQLAPGQQYRIDHQLNWDTTIHTAYPKFMVHISEVGVPRSDCRSANKRKEISAVEINKLFVAPLVSVSAASHQPLKIQHYRLLGGVGINTVEATLVYRKTSAGAGKLSASVAAPYSGIADEIPITGNSGTVKIHINIPCQLKDAANLQPQPVTITYRLWSSFSLSGASSWLAGFSTQQAIAYNELCVAVPGAPNPSAVPASAAQSPRTL